MRSGFVAGVVAALVACRGGAPPAPAPEVRLFATVGDAAVAPLAAAAERAGVARVRRVDAARDADVLWLGDPAEAIEAGPLLAEGTVPQPEPVARRFLDARARWAPLCARALVLVVSPRAALPLEPASVRDVADPRLAGRVAVAPLGEGRMATALSALAIAYGEASLRRFLELLARNAPRVAADERAARALVASRGADLALVGSEEAAAGAASAAELQVVVPDQQGRGAVVLPTAVALTARGAAAPAPVRLAAWLVGPDAERLLVARAPGFMPLRPEVPVPVGVRPAGHVVALKLDWDRLAEERRRLAPALGAWRPGGALAPERR